MILAIDIGNTQIKVGIFDKNNLIHSFSFNGSKNILTKLSKPKLVL